MQEMTINNLEEMKAFAATVADRLRGGEVLGLVGDLGAGKTTFVQLLAEALGVKGAVKSPTFILMQQLATDRTAPRSVCHVDAYRLKDWKELAAIGFEEFAGRKDVTCVVEWADVVPEVQQFGTYSEMRFSAHPNESRQLALQGPLFV